MPPPQEACAAIDSACLTTLWVSVRQYCMCAVFVCVHTCPSLQISLLVGESAAASATSRSRVQSASRFSGCDSTPPVYSRERPVFASVPALGGPAAQV